MSEMMARLLHAGQNVGRWAGKTDLRNKSGRWVRRVVSVAFRAFFLLGFCFVILYPVFMMIMKAFMNRMDLFDNSVVLVPRHFTLQNFQIAGILLNYWSTLGNTLLYAFVITALETASCLLVGYGFGRFRFRGRNLMFALVIFTIVVPPELIMIPMYMQFRQFNPFNLVMLFGGKPFSMLDTLWPFSLLAATSMYTKNGLFVFMFRQFFRGMPKELEEAAYIDGAGSFRTFTTVMLPNAVTVLSTVTLFAFVWQYNDVIYSRMFLTQSTLFANAFSNLTQFTNQVYNLLQTDKFDLTMVMYQPLVQNTGMLMIMAPLFIVFAVSQRFFVDSIERSGIVG